MAAFDAEKDLKCDGEEADELFDLDKYVIKEVIPFISARSVEGIQSIPFFKEAVLIINVFFNYHQ